MNETGLTGAGVLIIVTSGVIETRFPLWECRIMLAPSAVPIGNVIFNIFT